MFWDFFSQPSTLGLIYLTLFPLVGWFVQWGTRFFLQFVWQLLCETAPEAIFDQCSRNAPKFCHSDISEISSPFISHSIPVYSYYGYYGWWISPVSPRIPLIFFFRRGSQVWSRHKAVGRSRSAPNWSIRWVNWSPLAAAANWRFR